MKRPSSVSLTTCNILGLPIANGFCLTAAAHSPYNPFDFPKNIFTLTKSYNPTREDSMTSRMIAIVLMVTTFAIFIWAQAPQPGSKSAVPSLQGAWRMSELTTTGANGSTNRTPQPGLWIFTGRHYSMVTVNSTTPRPDLPQDINTATADQLRAAWQPFTGQAGTYEVKGSTVTFRPIVAKNPGVMATGNFNTLSYKVDGNTLTLTQTAGRNGPVANPTTFKFNRVE
jgi:hypothetical protein